MKRSLDIGSIKIPTEAATKAFALLAKRGAGKSYTGAVMAEEFARNGIPFVVFDPIDVWWGLRLAANGKDKGLPVVVFGLQHADIQLDRTMGKKIARAVVDENISCVISTFGMSKTDMRNIIADFAEELLNINNTPRHVFIEEAHEFVPQRVFGAGARCFAAVEALLVMGRNRGIGVTLINQRAATLNKDLLTQVDTLLALRSVGPQDRKALKEWVEFHSAEGDLDKFLESLPSLPTGEAWLWSPEFMETFQRIKIRKRETFHPDREKLGSTFKMPEIKQGDIQSFIDKFKTPAVKATVKNIDTTQRTNRVAVVVDKQALANEYSRGLSDGLASANREWQKVAKKLQDDHARFVIAVRRGVGFIGKNLDEINSLIEKNAVLPIPAPSTPTITSTTKINTIPVGSTPGAVVITNSSPTSGTTRMLVALASNPDGLTKQQLATIANVKLTGGSFRTYLSQLRISGYICEAGDIIEISDSGKEFIGPQKVVEPADVREMWLGKMGGGARTMLKVLIDLYPGAISKGNLADQSGISILGGSFRTYLSQLKVNGLIEVDTDGDVKASPTLFDK